MPGENGWGEHKLHVLSTLERLEAKQDTQTQQIGDIHREIVGFKANQKWHMRIGGVLWGIIVTAVNVLIGKH